MENKQYELDVYALVNSLMTKLGITYPIDYLLEWYNHTDKVPTPFISPMIKDSVNASVKHDNTIEKQISPNVQKRDISLGMMFWQVCILCLKK